MAKQTFTTGQVLTAAQMTSLQQTAMLGGAASAKTASYTLVAADAGTAISMSNASATTITVNTALFAAGDTVQITNIGAGVCTITAGTATVNTSASLALAQYESGTLDFTSTSAAIFIKGAGASSGGMTLISTTTLSGATTTVSSIPSSYNNLQVIIRNAKPATDGTSLRVRVNGDSGTNYLHQTANFSPNEAFSETGWSIHQELDNSVVTGNICFINLYDYTGSHWKTGNSFGANNDYTTTANSTLIVRNLIYNGTGAITSLVFYAGSGNLTSGDVLLYGVK